MAPKKPLAVTRAEAARLRRAIRDGEALNRHKSGTRPPLVRGVAAHHNFVRLTSDARADGTYYPGVWCQWQPLTGTFLDGLPVWVAEANGEDLSTSLYYWARMEGDKAINGDRRAVFVPACCGGGGDVTGDLTVTGEVTAGNLTVTKVTAATNAIVTVTTETVDSTGTPAAGLGGKDVKQVDTTTGIETVATTTFELTDATGATYQVKKSEAVENYNGSLTYFTVTTSSTGTLTTVLGNNVTGSVTVNPATSTTIGNSQTTTVTVNPTTNLVLKPDSGNPVTIGGGTSANPLRFLEPSGSGSNYIQFTAPAMAGDTSYTLPNAYPGANGYSLTSTTAGVLSWTNVSGGTGFTIGSAISGGTAGRIIFEDGSNQIAQSANLTYSSNTFTVTDSGGADIQHWVYSAATVTRISEVGSLHTLKTQAADAEIDTSEVSWFTNPTNGAPGVGWKGKSNDATVYEVEIGAYTTSAPATNSGTPTTRYGGDTNYCGDPNAWLVWKINGTTYKIPAYT